MPAPPFSPCERACSLELGPSDPGDPPGEGQASERPYDSDGSRIAARELPAEPGTSCGFAREPGRRRRGRWSFPEHVAANPPAEGCGSETRGLGRERAGVGPAQPRRNGAGSEVRDRVVRCSWITAPVFGRLQPRESLPDPAWSLPGLGKTRRTTGSWARGEAIWLRALPGHGEI